MTSGVVTHTVTTTATAAAATTSSSSRVSPQGGILEGGNPTIYDPKNPIIVFVIQAGIIIVVCRLLHYPLSKMRQPRVIAEVIGGIVLGPSVLGHIPNFQTTIFPNDSMPALTLVANLGLVLFLFLVGLETDLRFLVSSWRYGLSVSVAGMILPFGLGCIISIGLYNEFRNDPGLVPITYGTYLLFIGIAMAITAFPVLCRILTELKLLSTSLGVIVLSAGVGNDVTGWILLALCVALVNAGSGLTALWVLLVCVGYVLFLVYCLRPLFVKFLDRTGSLQKGPSQSVVAVTLLLALTSAFFTQVIGVHAIFGGFLIGLICPHEGGFAIKLTEKIEDLVATLFLPLYFALSGLQTNLGLLDSGIVWAYVIGIIAIAFFAKVIGGTLAAWWAGLLWRESCAVGVLMSCKGLVELIVLNIGLQAKILSQRTFTMFVVMALVTTFATTPLTTFLYPPWYQTKVERWRRGEIDWDDAQRTTSDGGSADEKLQSEPVRRVLVYLRLESLPSACSFVSLLVASGKSKPPAARLHYEKRGSALTVESNMEEQQNAVQPEDRPSLQVHSIRLLELGDRLSGTMKVYDEDYTAQDPVVNTFRTFSQLNYIPSQGRLAVVSKQEFAATIADMARAVSADFLLIPWSESGSMNERHDLSADRVADASYSAFVADLLPRVTSSNVGIFIDRVSITSAKQRPNAERSTSAMSVQSLRNRPAFLPTASPNQHLFFPFLGGSDDRFALRLVLQMAQSETVTATVVHIDIPASSTGSPPPTAPADSGPDTEKEAVSVTSLPISSKEKEADNAFFAAMRDSLPADLSLRVIFRRRTLTSTETNAIQLAVSAARDEASHSSNNVNQIVVVGRGSVGREAHFTGLPSGIAEEGGTRKATGLLGDAMIHSVRGSVLVVQAAR